MPESTGNCRLNLQGIAGKTLFSITGDGVIAMAFWHALGGEKNSFGCPTPTIENRLQPKPRSADPVFFTANLT